MLSLAENVHYIYEVFNPDRDPGRCQISFPKWFTHLPLDTGEPYYSALKATIVGHKYNLLRGLQSARSPGEIKERYAEYLNNWTASRKPELRSLLKDPIAIFSAEWLADRFDMDVVVLIRHPANFVSSLIKHEYYFTFEDLRSQPELMNGYLEPFAEDIINPPTEILDQAVLLWRMIYSVVLYFKRNYPSWIFVRYEDLAADPIMEFQTLYEQLNLSWTPDIEQIVLGFSSAENPVDTKNPMNIKRHSQGLVDQWRNRLSLEQSTLIKEKTVDIWPKFYKDNDW